MADFTVDTLVEKVKRWGSIPTVQSLFTKEDFIEMLNDDLQYDLTPTIVSVREEYFIRYQEVNILNGQDEYIIPSRAVAGALRDVMVVYNQDNIKTLRRIDPADAGKYRDAYYIRGNRLVLVDSSQYPNGKIRFNFPCRPNSLVESIAAASITAIDYDLNTVTVASYPTAWNVSNTFDLVQNNSPFDWLGIDEPVTSINANTFQFASVPNELAIGDWVCLAGESPIPQIPVEAINLLCQGVVVKCMEAQNDQTGMT